MPSSCRRVEVATMGICYRVPSGREVSVSWSNEEEPPPPLSLLVSNLSLSIKFRKVADLPEPLFRNNLILSFSTRLCTVRALVDLPIIALSRERRGIDRFHNSFRKLQALPFSRDLYNPQSLYILDVPPPHFPPQQPLYKLSPLSWRFPSFPIQTQQT